PVAGLTRAVAWAGIVLVAWLPLVALFTARRERAAGRGPGFVMRILDWAAYTAMGLSSLLIVSFVVIDLLRLPGTVHLVMAVVSGAAFLTLLGIVLARRPRVVHVTVPIADLPSDLAGLRSRRGPSRVHRRATCACCWRTSRAAPSPHKPPGTTSSSPGTRTAGSISPSICWCGSSSRS